MEVESKRRAVAATMRQINRAWLDGYVEELEPMLHPGIIMVLPGFAGRIQGRESVLGGVRDFCQSATVHEFREDDWQVDVAAAIAVVTFRYQMIYERSGERFRSTGRDLWVFQEAGTMWVAVWRTMLDVADNPV